MDEEIEIFLKNSKPNKREELDKPHNIRRQRNFLSDHGLPIKPQIVQLAIGNLRNLGYDRPTPIMESAIEKKTLVRKKEMK